MAVAVSVPALSEKDKEDLRWALHLQADLRRQQAQTDDQQPKLGRLRNATLTHGYAHATDDLLDATERELHRE